MIIDFTDTTEVLNHYKAKNGSSKIKNRGYISKNEIKAIAAVLTTFTLLKNEKELEKNIVNNNPNSFIDIDSKKISKFYEKYKEREEEFYAIYQKIINYYNDIDKQIVNKAAKQASLYIENLFRRLAKKHFTIKGIAFVFLFSCFCEEYGAVAGTKAKDELFGKFKKISWYDPIFDFFYEEIDNVDFWDEVNICQNTLI